MSESISASQAARLLDLSKTWVLKLVKDGILEGQKIGNYYAISKASVEAYQAARQKSEAAKK